MTHQPFPLDVIDIAAPCPASWEKMRGDERVRFCDECKLNVYDLSAMTRTEAEALVSSREDRLCIRFYRRIDGKIATKNCSRLRAAARRTKGLLAAVGAAALFIAMLPLSVLANRTTTSGSSRDRPSEVGRIWLRLLPFQDPPVAGKIAVPMQGTVAPREYLGGMMAPLPPTSRPATQPTTLPTTLPSDDVRMGRLGPKAP